MDDEVAKAERRGCKDTARVIGFVVSLLMLIWLVHMGYRLTTETRDIGSGDAEGGYVALVFGVVTVVFGLIYFIIGLTIVVELAMELIAWLKQEDTRTINRGNNTFNL